MKVIVKEVQGRQSARKPRLGGTVAAALEDVIKKEAGNPKKPFEDGF